MKDHHAHVHETMAARVRRLHDVLNLTSNQDAALNAMLEAMAPAAHRGEMKHQPPEALANLTTPQRLDRVAAHMAEHQANFQRRVTAIKQFYAVLSPQQQKAFDALPDLTMDGDHHMGPPPMGSGGPPDGVAEPR